MSLALDAPLLPAGCHAHEQRVRDSLEGLVEEASQALGERLVAVVLGGSLARGAGVVLSRGSESKLLSDIDLYFVVAEPLSETARELESRLRTRQQADPFFAAPLDLGFVGESWFSRLPSTIPAHQLAHGNRVIHARPSGFEVRIPSTEGEGFPRIDRDDALRLLMNRYAEQILLDATEPQSDFACYHRWKLVMDAPLAWLALEGRYHPRRGGQRELLRELAGRGTAEFEEWLGGGLARLEGIQSAIERGPLAPEAFGELSGDELSWSWPFYRAGLQVAARKDREGGEDLLREAVARGAPCENDLELGSRWLRRRPLLFRVREARRWSRERPAAGSSWVTHARGGAGRDRVQLACSLFYAGLSGWVEPLRDLVKDDELMRRSQSGDRGVWLGGLWSTWVMGGSR